MTIVRGELFIFTEPVKEANWIMELGSLLPEGELLEAIPDIQDYR